MRVPIRKPPTDHRMRRNYEARNAGGAGRVDPGRFVGIRRSADRDAGRGGDRCRGNRGYDAARHDAPQEGSVRQGEERDEEQGRAAGRQDCGVHDGARRPGDRQRSRRGRGRELHAGAGWSGDGCRRRLGGGRSGSGHDRGRNGRRRARGSGGRPSRRRGGVRAGDGRAGYRRRWAPTEWAWTRSRWPIAWASRWRNTRP